MSPIHFPAKSQGDCAQTGNLVMSPSVPFSTPLGTRHEDPSPHQDRWGQCDAICYLGGSTSLPFTPVHPSELSSHGIPSEKPCPTLQVTSGAWARVLGSPWPCLALTTVSQLCQDSAIVVVILCLTNRPISSLGRVLAHCSLSRA